MFWLIIEEQDGRAGIYLNLQLNQLQVDETFVEFPGKNVQVSSFAGPRQH